MNLEHMAQDLTELQKAPHARRLFVRCPVVFIAGEDSDYITPGAQANIQRQFPRATIEWIEEAGHLIHIDQPQALINCLKKGLAL